ncbi:MAG: hypothetical protein OEO82_08880 [Gammaproteobacteria bacterium]|nr:hypothetical protein [Gammaproteobacteria bacterium]
MATQTPDTAAVKFDAVRLHEFVCMSSYTCEMPLLRAPIATMLAILALLPSAA